MLEKYTRWNADHSLCTLVRFDQDPDLFAFCAQDYRVLVCDEDMARIFRVPLCSEDSVRSAINGSNQEFYIQFDGEHFAILGEEPQKHFVGLIDVCKNVLDRSQKLDELNRTFEPDYAKALVDGTVYEAFLYEGDNIVDSCSGLIDLQYASTLFKRSHPECCYSDDDFIEEGWDFILKSEVQR